jgi:hypothetical protein
MSTGGTPAALPRYVVRAVIDDATCPTCRAAHRSEYMKLDYLPAAHCEHVKNGTGICRCILGGPSRESVEAARGVKLTATGLYPDRNCMHRNMGPPELFPCCGGRGYFPGGSEDSPNDRYCDCAAGRERRRTDG